MSYIWHYSASSRPYTVVQLLYYLFSQAGNNAGANDPASAAWQPGTGLALIPAAWSMKNIQTAVSGSDVEDAEDSGDARTLWMGDLAPWMDESFLLGLFQGDRDWFCFQAKRSMYILFKELKCEVPL